MSVVYGPTGLPHDARDLAQVLLVGLPRRWRHTIGVARQAENLIAILDTPEDREILVAAAWLHDIGYSDTLRDTGFHPLDGARYLHRHGWPLRLAGLVAHHSEALSIARVRGFVDDLGCFPREYSMVTDALIYADQTVDPGGDVTSFEDRLADMLRRHGPDSPNAAAHPQRGPLLHAAVRRVEQRRAERRRPSSTT